MPSPQKQLHKKLLDKCKQLLEAPLSLDKALLLAVLAHTGQKDQGENSYIRHALRVMEKQHNEELMITAVLHDTAEDTDISLKELEDFGLSTTQLVTLDALTKRPNENYKQRIQRALQCPAARQIKMADIQDNLQLKRLKNKDNLQEKDMHRIKNYIEALGQLEKAK